MKEIYKEALFLNKNCSFELGDEHKVDFWEGYWCGSTPLCVSFPSLYELTSSKRAKEVDLWEAIGMSEG